ncbi:hypothetical protein LJR098_001109 [Rhizobium sp. LjRoot98]|uniref:hypothetical protein n=1 Tax=Rhizobium sp. LjRoot98 TaxID=3342345 RepID=UPI003ECD6339
MPDDQDDPVRSAADRIKRRSLITPETKGVDPADLQAARRRYYCGSGWHAILDKLMHDLSELTGVRFVAAGEKWSALEIMYECEPEQTDAVYAATSKAVAAAAIICETCGQRGIVRKTGWWKVLCDEHANGDPK